MKKKFKLGVIGAGFMSYSIVSGALRSNFLDFNSVIVSDINDSSFDKFKGLNVFCTKNNQEVFDGAEFVLLAVKPQNFTEAVKNILPKENKMISIMAGVIRSAIKDGLRATLPVARCMPNTPCSIGYGAVGIDASDYTDKADKDFIDGLFSSFAQVVFLDESKLNAVTGISGSSPAYFYLFIKHVVDAGIKQGLTPQEAKTLAVNTMIGSGKMLLANSETPIDDLISAVCSKGGTTIEAIKVFNESDFKQITENAIDACVKRASELEGVL